MSRSKLSIQKIKKLNYNGEVKKDFCLSSICTFKCGGKANLFLQINTLENFIKTMMYLNETKTKYFVIGAGSNLLVSDNGYDGVVIKLGGDLSRIEVSSDEKIECGAGVTITQAYTFCKNLNLSGFEDGAGIPATIGGAVFMNASAYEFKISDIVDYVVAYVDGKITYFHNSDCEFGYRKSIFQTNKAIILRVGFKLIKRDKILIENRFKEVLLKRNNTQPTNYPSAGCVFKKRDDIEVSKKLDEFGLKGLTFGGAKISSKHANFIINYDNASAQDIFELIEITKKRFYKKSGIMLDTELIFLGEFDETTG